MTDEELLLEAEKLFPSGCSYITADGKSKRYNVKYNKPYFHYKGSIALGAGKGLVYEKGVWAIRINSDDTPYIEENISYEIY